MQRKRRLLELLTVAALAASLLGALAMEASPTWLFVASFAAVIIVGENTPVIVHNGTGVSPSFMTIMAAIALLSADGNGVVLGAGLVGVCGGLYLPHLKARRFGVLMTNCGQFALSAMAAAVAYQLLDSVNQPVAALGSAMAYAAINITLVVLGVGLYYNERFRAVWADMRPALPNYLAFGLLGLLIGLICAELGPLAVALLAVPMLIGRANYSSFVRLREAHDATIRLFIRLIEAKDPYTAGHTERVAGYALYIAEELGVPADRLEHLRQSALMHDVGKLAVPSRLLNKPGRLTAEEYEVVRSHNDAGIGILSRVDFMRTMAVTASDRHGRFEDGGDGAPSDLVREAHIVAVADAFDAMTSTRSYRRALDQDVAFEELRRNAGTQFAPECVEALVTAIEKRGERFGLGYEVDAHEFAVPPPVAGVGSAGLGDLDGDATAHADDADDADDDADQREATP